MLTLLVPLLVLPSACASAPPMWKVFAPGASWAMRSSADGHLTRFDLQRLSRWGCWRGDIIDLVDHKRSANDYWEIGGDVVGHQIELRGRDGSWRMIGTYAQSPDPSEEWTMQVHRYPGHPIPYVIVPSRRVSSDTRTEYYTLFSTGIVSRCLRGGPSAAPGWGRNVYWRSKFTFVRNGTLHAHYEENHECGPIACQIENWTFAPGRLGMTQVADLRAGGHPMSLVLRRFPRR